MAKYVQIFEDGEIKNKLTFRGKTYDFALKKQVNGKMESNKKGFSSQLKEDGIDLNEINEELKMNDYDEVDYLGKGDENDTIKIISILSDLE